MKRTITATALIIALGGFLFGYDIAMISGTTTQLETLFNLSKFWLGFTVAIAIIGTIIGIMIIGKHFDKYGRRRMLIFLSGLFVITTLGSSLSINWYILLLIRFITGILLGGNTVVTPMFIAEGSWRWMIGIEIIPALTFFLLLFKVPESPRWLLIKDRLEEALQVFKSYGFTDP